MAVPGYLRDHHIGPLTVLPAVEALQILARSKPAAWDAESRLQEGVLFHHLLAIDPAAAEMSLLQEHERYADGSCLSRLTTIRRRGTVSRRMEHLLVRFVPAAPGSAEGNAAPPPGDSGPDDAVAGRMAPAASADAGRISDRAFGFPGLSLTFFDTGPTDGAAFRVGGSRLYQELVPFGPAYRNIRGDVWLTPEGAWATVSGGNFPEAEGPLGSPFPFDAAMHAACAWGQRYGNRVVFPVAFDRREIFRPTRTAQTYLCRISPRPGEGSSLCFDLWICDRDQRPAEAVRGLRMREIPGGKLTPPAWVREGV